MISHMELILIIYLVLICTLVLSIRLFDQEKNMIEAQVEALVEAQVRIHGNSNKTATQHLLELQSELEERLK